MTEFWTFPPFDPSERSLTSPPSFEELQPQRASIDAEDLARIAHEMLPGLRSWVRVPMKEPPPPPAGGASPSVLSSISGLDGRAVLAIFLQLWDRATGEHRAWVAWAPDPEIGTRVEKAFEAYTQKDDDSISRWFRTRERRLQPYRGALRGRKDGKTIALAGGAFDPGDNVSNAVRTMLQGCGAELIDAFFFPHHQITGSLAVLTTDAIEPAYLLGLQAFGAAVFARVAMQAEARNAALLLDTLGLKAGGRKIDGSRVYPLVRTVAVREETRRSPDARGEDWLSFKDLQSIATSAARAAREVGSVRANGLYVARRKPAPDDLKGRCKDALEKAIAGVRTSGATAFRQRDRGLLRCFLEEALTNAVRYADHAREGWLKLEVGTHGVAIENITMTDVVFWPSAYMNLYQALEADPSDLAPVTTLEEHGVGALCYAILLGGLNESAPIKERYHIALGPAPQSNSPPRYKVELSIAPAVRSVSR